MSDPLSNIRIPTIPTLPIGEESYGPAQSALSEEGRALAQQQRQRSDAMDQLSTAAKILQTIGQDSAFISMQGDILKAKEEITQSAVDIVRKGVGKGYTFEQQNEADMSKGGPAGPRSGDVVMKLDPQFQTGVDNVRQSLIDKYSQYPTVLKAALDTLDSTVLEAHKSAYVQATAQVLDQGKQGISDNLEQMRKLDIQNRNTNGGDAIFNNPMTSNFLSPSAIEAMRDRYHKEVNDGVFSADLARDVKEQGVQAALDRISTRTDADDQKKASWESDVRRLDSAEQNAADQSALAKAQALVGNGVSNMDAAATSVEGLPDFRAGPAEAKVNSFFKAKQSQYDEQVGQNLDANLNTMKLTDVRQWYTNPQDNFASKMSPTAYREGLRLIDERDALEEKIRSGALTETDPTHYNKLVDVVFGYSTDQSPQAKKKLSDEIGAAKDISEPHKIQLYNRLRDPLSDPTVSQAVKTIGQAAKDHPTDPTMQRLTANSLATYQAWLDTPGPKDDKAKMDYAQQLSEFQGKNYVAEKLDRWYSVGERAGFGDFFGTGQGKTLAELSNLTQVAEYAKLGNSDAQGSITKLQDLAMADFTRIAGAPTAINKAYGKFGSETDYTLMGLTDSQGRTWRPWPDKSNPGDVKITWQMYDEKTKTFKTSQLGK